jgi:hypothetical protein
MIITVVGFTTVGELVLNWVGLTVFKADVTFDELVRALGLAYVWQVVVVLGVLSAFIAALECIFAPIIVLSLLAMIVACFMAAKEALDLEWMQTIITVILGGIALSVIITHAGIILGILGFGAAALGGRFV